MSAVEEAAEKIRAAGFSVGTADGFPLVRAPETIEEKERLIETLVRLGFSFTIAREGVAVFPT